MPRPLRTARGLPFVLAGLAAAVSVRAGVGQWTNRGLPGVSVLSVTADPVDPLAVYASAREGTYKSADGGQSWTRIGGSSEALAIDPANPSSLYAGGSGVSGVSKSADGGRTFSAAQNGLSCLFVTALAIDPAVPSTLLAGASDLLHEPIQCGGLFRAVDSGATWREVLPDSIAHAGIAIDAANPSRVFLLEFDEKGNVLLRSEDGGSTWSFLANPPPAPLGIFPDPYDASVIYAAAIDGVYVSRDGGGAWQREGLDGIIVMHVLVDPRDPSVLYAATLSRGVFTSRDRGASWSAVNAGLTDLSTVSLAMSSDGARLYAGTTTAGVFDYEIVARGLPAGRPERSSPRAIAPRP